MATMLPPVPPFTQTLPPTAPSGAAPASVRRVPGQRSPTMEAMLALATEQRDVLEGIDGLRRGGELYLPRLTGESPEYFARRLALAGFFNAPLRTVKAMAGLICQRDPELGEDGSGAAILADQWESWDDQGNHGAVVTRRLCEDGVSVGVAGLLVDMPALPQGVDPSRPDAARLNLRPYVVPIKVEQIIDADGVLFGARFVLTYLELHETDERRAGASEPGAFGRVTVERYRVYERPVDRDPITGRVINVGDPTVQVWETQPGETEPRAIDVPAPLLGGGRQRKPLSAIPFAVFLTGEILSTSGGWKVRPPLKPLVELALQWYQVYAERRNAVNRSAMPTPWLKDYKPIPIPGETNDDGSPKYKDLVLGPSEAILVGKDGGAGYLAPPADVFQPTKDDLDDLERRMAALGLAFLMSETRAAETAQGKRIDAAAQNATLSAIARALQDCLETALAFHAEYLGVEPVSVGVNTDFERITADPLMIDALSKLAQVGQITIETLLALLERWRVLPDGFDVTAEVEKLPKPVAPPVAGAAPSTAGGLFDKVRADMALATTGQTPPPATNAPPAQAA